MAIRKVFQEIYDRNVTLVGTRLESISGSGSSIEQTQKLIRRLEAVILLMNIRSMLDIPCGDFNWMRGVNLSTLDYIGADIIPDLIEKNRARYPWARFEVMDITRDDLSQVDLVFVRDCWVHFSDRDIWRSVENIRRSGSEYLLATTFTDHHPAGIVTGQWHPLNLQDPPFNFPEPLLWIDEGCTEEDNAYTDKSMGLWEINMIPTA
jgi:hypothetical protein